MTEKKIFKILSGLTVVYAFLILFGGLMGFAFKKSIPSLISGAVFSALLLFSAILTMAYRRVGPILSCLLSIILMLFFSYRFLITKAVFPSGILSLLTISVLLMQLVYFQKLKSLRKR